MLSYAIAYAFQSHNGSIKTENFPELKTVKPVFQSHNGSIKTTLHEVM